MSDSYAVVDIETTGSRRFGQKIIEIAIIHLDQGEISGRWSTLINPERHIPYSITQLTGITDGMVADAPKFYEVAKKIIELTQDRIFVAHNVYFDYKFIQSEFAELGFTFKREVVCTVKSSRKAFPDLPSYSLSQLSKHFSLQRISEHRALDDAEATAKLFLMICEKLETSVLPEKIFLPPHLDEDKFLALPELPGTYLFYSEQGHLLYVGKAKNILKRVKSHFRTLGKNKRDLELRKYIAKIDFHLWGCEELASLMELHEIKTLFPSMNRASRKRRYRYRLSFHPLSSPGDEIRVCSVPATEEGLYGSRQVALNARKKAYQGAFGLDVNSIYFNQEMKKWRTILGDDAVMLKLKNYLQLENDQLPDGVFAFPVKLPIQSAYVVINNGSLDELRLMRDGDESIYSLTHFPDMARLMMKLLRYKVVKDYQV